MKKISVPAELIYDGNLILVNAQYPLKQFQESKILVSSCEEDRSVMVLRQVQTALSGVMQALNGWSFITAVSGFRSMGEQTAVFNGSLLENGKEFTDKYVAKPGHSEHQTGLAVDLALRQKNIDFIRPEFPYSGICQEFRNKALSYGLIERYREGAEHITGISHEPWHFRYVGWPHSEIMTEKNMVLEEYLQFLKQFAYGKKSFYYRSGSRESRICYREAVCHKTGGVEERMQFEIENENAFDLSGNNMDGFILTQWGGCL